MRKLFCLFVALVACLMLATVASAETTVPTTCEACGGIEVEWTPLTASTKWYNLDEGHYHYYLTANDTTYRYTPNPASSDAATSTNSKNPVTICLDLNGYNITTKGRAVGLYNGCTLNIMDSSEAQTGYIQGGHGTNNLVGGTFFSYGTLNLYQGTLRYSNDSTLENKCYAGAVISMGSGYSNATFNMYGGRLEGGDLIEVSGKNCHGGTIFAEKGNINIYNGEIVAGSVQEGYYGPCIYTNGSVKLTLSGDADVDNIFVRSSTVTVNISGTYSGKARLTYADTVSLSGGKVVGTATNTPSLTGDLFCTNGNGWIPTVDGSSLKLTAYTSCGEWHYCQHCKEIRRWTAMTASNYTKPNATVDEYHYYVDGQMSNKQVQICKDAQLCFDLYGNTYINQGRALLANAGATLNLMDTVGNGVVQASGGTNNERGATMSVSSGGTINMYSGTVRYVPGTATKAKNGMVGIGGTFNMYGGTIEGADLTNNAASTGGAIYMYNSSSVLNLCGGTVTSGQVSTVAPCVYVNTKGQTVKLSGNVNVENIYFAYNEKDLIVSGDYTGTTSVTFKTSPSLGDEVGVSENARILGYLTCTNGDWIIKPEGGKLVVAIDAPVVVIDGEDETGYATLQEAIDACEGGYLKLLRPMTEDVTVDKDLLLDVNGWSVTGTVTVSDGAVLYVKDSQTDDYTVSDGVYGKLTVSGQVAAQEGYLMVDEAGEKSFHRITVQITDMTLRSENAGIYYKSTFLGDEKVAEEVESFGVALSVQEAPNASNMETKCKYSEFTDFAPGAAGNPSASTLLKNILKSTNPDIVNGRNMGVDIYGRAYIKTSAGYIFGTVQRRDLAQQMTDVDEIFATLTASQRYALMGMYDAYESVLGTLNLTNIAGEQQRNENTLSIMMVGNSFCYYYVEELYGLLMANPDPNRGYDAVEIYNLYYSGCTLAQHYQWWINDQANYDLYKTDINGRVKQKPQVGDVWKLEEALIQGQWDYMSLQGLSTGVDYGNGSVEENGAFIAEKAAPLLGRFHELFPDAQLLWHRTWPFEVGRISNGTAYTEETLAAYNAGMQATCDWMCTEFDKDKPYDLKIVNSGAAWPIARAENARLETSLIPDGGLCARLGVRNENTYPYLQGNANAGDGYHDGDIGGGQFLNACVWYETITGQSCLENSYKPTKENGKYELSDAFAQLLRNAAHTALNP